jgi:hypothetical protein
VLAAGASLAACASAPADSTDTQSEESLNTVSYPTMTHACGIVSVHWLSTGDIATEQTLGDCGPKDPAANSSATLSIWHPSNPAHPCQSWDTSCTHGGGRLSAHYDLSANGDLIVASMGNAWAVSPSTVALDHGTVPWFGAPHLDWKYAPTIQQAALSHDRAFVAIRGSQGELFVADRVTGKATRVVVGAQYSSTSMATTLSWGGAHRLGYVSRVYPGNGQVFTTLAVADVGAGPAFPAPRTLTTSQGLSFIDVALAADGKSELVTTALATGTGRGSTPYTIVPQPMELRDEKLGVVRRFPKATGRNADPFYSVAFSPDGSHFLVIGSFADGFNGTRVFRIDADLPVNELKGVWLAAFSPDGTKLATAVDSPTTNGHYAHSIIVKPAF